MNRYALALCGMAGLLLSACAGKAVGAEDVYSPDAIKAVMKKTCDYMLANPIDQGKIKYPDLDRGWVRAAFYTGVMATYYTTQDEKYLKAALDWGQRNKWQANSAQRKGKGKAGDWHADDQASAQTYAECCEIRKDPNMIADARKVFDVRVASPKPGREDWWWCDSLFMAPPAMARVAKITGEKKYLDLMDSLWWDTTAYLYDKDEDLYYRDDKFFAKKTPSGKKVFWGRGNGWVMGGTCRVLQYMPADYPSRQKYVDLLKKMAKKVASLQQSDGLWRPSLLDPQEVPVQETSSSGFFCFALAWGINNGILDRAEYLPVVQKAWKALVGCVEENGKLGYVQPIGAAPDKVSKDTTQEYGVGAFLLAGAEMVKLAQTAK